MTLFLKKIYGQTCEKIQVKTRPVMELQFVFRAEGNDELVDVPNTGPRYVGSHHHAPCQC